MFGKRSGTAANEAPRTPPRAASTQPADPAPQSAAPVAELPPKPAAAQQPAKAAPPPPPKLAAAPQPKPGPKTAIIDTRSDDYYQIKSTIFSALIDTIDLAQLAQLDPDSAREEIRDIVNEIISIKAVVMSIAEQEALLQDICNDRSEERRVGKSVDLGGGEIM